MFHMPWQPGFIYPSGPPLRPPGIVFASRTADAQVSSPEPGQAPRSPRWKLAIAKDMARPGFMTLRAVRHHGLIVDFVWDNACPVARRLLSLPFADLRGCSLLRTLADTPCGAPAFARYRCVVQCGAAQAMRHQALVYGRLDTCRHGAVRWRDGVAVTLTNLSAIAQLQVLRGAARATPPPLIH